MDSIAGDLAYAAKEIDENIEKQSQNRSHNSSNDDFSSATENVGEKREELGPGSTGPSSEDDVHIDKLDSHIVKVMEVKEGERAYAHLPPEEKAIVKKQLDIPEVKVTFTTLYRYATKYDLIIVAISCICAIAGGAVMPLMTVSLNNLNCNQVY